MKMMAVLTRNERQKRIRIQWYSSRRQTFISSPCRILDPLAWVDTAFRFDAGWLVLSELESRREMDHDPHRVGGRLCVDRGTPCIQDQAEMLAYRRVRTRARRSSASRG